MSWSHEGGSISGGSVVFPPACHPWGPRSLRFEGPVHSAGSALAVGGRLHRSFAAKSAAQDDKTSGRTMTWHYRFFAQRLCSFVTDIISMFRHASRARGTRLCGHPRHTLFTS